jgi:hypothetical protein
VPLLVLATSETVKAVYCILFVCCLVIFFEKKQQIERHVALKAKQRLRLSHPFEKSSFQIGTGPLLCLCVFFFAMFMAVGACVFFYYYLFVVS